jgi:hypothetical protein
MGPPTIAVLDGQDTRRGFRFTTYVFVDRGQIAASRRK